MMNEKDKLTSLLSSIEVIKKYAPKEDEFYNKIDEKQSISSLDKPVSDDLFSELVHDTSSSSLLNEPVKNLKKERNAR